MLPDRERYARYRAAYCERFGTEPTATPYYIGPSKR